MTWPHIPDYKLSTLRLGVSVLLCLALLVGCAPRRTSPTGDYWPTKGWRTSSPEAQKMDGARLVKMLEDVKQHKLGLHSLLVIRNGYLVSESYFGAYRQKTKHELYSCTKSFSATLIGIARDKGLIDGLDRRVLDLLPERTFANPDPRKEAMTLENLLTMTSGLDWVEGDPTYQAMYRSSDWVKWVLDEPMREAPGGRFNYCSGCSHVLSAIVQQQTKMNTRDFAQQNLFGPLGITDYNWERDAAGIPIGGWGLQLTPRDMAKLGYLYLREGNWEGQQVVSAAWVQSATQKHITASDVQGYGYQWWTFPDLQGYAALGRYGQTIFVVPHLNLIIVTTAQMEDGHPEIYRLIEDYIIPACS